MKNVKPAFLIAAITIIFAALILFTLLYTSSKQSKLANINTDLRMKLTNKTNEVAWFKKALAGAKQKNSEATQENSELKVELLVLEKIAEAAKKSGKKHQNLRLDYTRLTKFLAALQKKNKKNVKSFNELNEDYLSAQSEIRFIKSLIDQLILSSLAEQGVKLGEIYFKTGSSKFFTHPARARVIIAKILKQIDPQLHQVVIVGECDEKRWRTNHELNDAMLSTNRALTILKVLGLKINFTSYVSGKGNVDNTRRVAVYIIPKNAVNTLDALIDLKKEME